MNNYCGMCGFSLDETALRAGRCPTCGAPIESPGDADVADIPTRPDAALAGVSAHSPPYAAAARFEAASGSANTLPGQREPRLQVDAGRTRDKGGRRRRRSRRVSGIWQGAFLALALVLVAAMSLYALTQRTPISIVVAPFTSSNASASFDVSSSSSAGSTAAASGTSTTAPTSQTPAGTQGSATGPNGSPPQSTPVPPTLSVSPTTFSFTACLSVNNKPQFTVANTGGTPMSWSASAAGSGYTLTPSSGSIDPGDHETVTVSKVLRSGTVTITAPSAHNSPQQVRITCTL
jgi:cytoskeletal protein RodZ